MTEDVLEEIRKEEFEKGQKEAALFFKLTDALKADLADSSVDEEKKRRISRALRRREKISWLLAEKPTVKVYAEREVPNPKIDESVAGMREFVAQKYGLNLTFEVMDDSLYATERLAPICENEGVIAHGSTCDGEFRRLAYRVIDDHVKGNDLPCGSMIITTRKFEPFAWGLTEIGKGLAAVSSAYENNDDLGPISAHELIHYMSADGQQHTKKSDRNCENYCLMNYVPAPDGQLCKPCETGLVAYVQGLDSVMREHGRRLLID